MAVAPIPSCQFQVQHTTAPGWSMLVGTMAWLHANRRRVSRWSCSQRRVRGAGPVGGLLLGAASRSLESIHGDSCRSNGGILVPVVSVVGPSTNRTSLHCTRSDGVDLTRTTTEPATTPIANERGSVVRTSGISAIRGNRDLGAAYRRGVEIIRRLAPTYRLDHSCDGRRRCSGGCLQPERREASVVIAPALSRGRRWTST